MKKKAVWIIGALAVVGLVLFIMAHTTLAKQINKKLDAPKAWNVVSIEKMDVDKDPVLHDIKADSATYGELVKEIEKTNMKWGSNGSGDGNQRATLYDDGLLGGRLHDIHCQ